MNLQTINLSEIVTNPIQPRKHFDEQALQELSESIKSDGLMQPITVRKVSRDTIDCYEIVQGERRYRAAKLAGITEIQAFIQELTDEDAFHLAVIENIQREQLTPIEEAEAFMKYVEMGFTHAQIAEKVNKSRTYVTSRMRLLQLIPEVQDMIAEGKISEGHAKQLLKLRNELPGKLNNEKPFNYAQGLFITEYKEADKISVNEVKEFSGLVSQSIIRAIIRVFNKETDVLEALDMCTALNVDITDIKNEHLELAAEYEINNMKEGDKRSNIYARYEAIEADISKLSPNELNDKWTEGFLKLSEVSINKHMQTFRESQTDIVKTYRKAAEMDKSGHKKELNDKADRIEKMTIDEYLDYALDNFKL